MRHFIWLIILSMAFVQASTAQEATLDGPRWEFAGTLHFSMNDQPESSWLGKSEHRTYNWALQPEVGFFLHEQVELGVNIRFHQVREEGAYLRTSYSKGSTDYTVSSDLTVAMGVGYNARLSSWVWPFVFWKAGLSWKYNSFREGCIVSEMWSTPRVVFPIIQGGIKCFISRSVAVVMQGQYEHTSSEDQSKFAYGIGFAVYI
jgi:hypothetical protein